MATKPNDLIIASLAGGLNDTDPPQAIENDECVRAENVEFLTAALGSRRLGMQPLSLTSSGLTGETGITHIVQWYPTNDIQSPEIVAFAATPDVRVKVAYKSGGVWTPITPTDTIDPLVIHELYSMHSQSIDGKIFFTHHTLTQDRLHVWDGTTFRRVGLLNLSADASHDIPGITNTGAGNYTGLRYFRVRYIVMSGATVLLRSEPCQSPTPFTPSGTGAAARVQRPPLPGEGETHWEVEASEDNANYYRIAQVPVATTTYDDTCASSKTFPAISHAAPTSNDGTSVLYVLLSDQAAALNLTGTVAHGSYGNPGGTIAGRGWIGYDSGGIYIPAFPTTWTAGENWYASPDVATTLEAAASGNSGNYADVGVLSEALGAYRNIWSAKYLAIDGDRLIFASHIFGNDQFNSTVGWTPTKADPGVGNFERFPIVTTGGDDITTSIDLDNYDGGGLTGLAASTFGTWYAFKWQRIYSAIRTGNVAQAYDINTISTSRGAIEGSIVKAGESGGTAAIFFLDPYVGPCKLGTGGVVSPIHGVHGTWGRVNLSATIVARSVYYPYKKQIIWYVAVDGSNFPNLGIKLQLSELAELPNGELGKGFSTITGTQATNVQAAAALTATVGNVTTEVPFVGLLGPNFIQQTDIGNTDNGTSYTATIRSKPIFLTGLLNKFRIRAAALLGTAESNSSVKLTLIKDEGLETSASHTINLAPTGSEVQIIAPIDDMRLSELRAVQIELTDAFPNTPWEVQRVDLKPSFEEQS